jgi:Protein of unknown function (DUF2849)
MKIITAHDLRSGEVLYRAKGGAWAAHIAEALAIDDEHADAELASARAEATIVTNAYLVAIDGPGRPAKREYLRESIRASGPTVRADLGKQAESA